MNNTWGFINASQQTTKIMKTGSRSRGRHWSFFTVFTQHLSARDPGFWSRFGWFLLSVAWQEEVQGGLWAAPGPAHLQHKWSELIVHVWGDGGRAYVPPRLQNMMWCAWCVQKMLDVNRHGPDIATETVDLWPKRSDLTGQNESIK